MQSMFVAFRAEFLDFKTPCLRFLVFFRCVVPGKTLGAN